MKIKNIVKFGFFALLLLVLFLLEQQFQISSYIRASQIRSWVDGFGIYAPIVFIVSYALAIPAFIPASPFSIAAGGLFGPYIATVYISLGATTGASLAFLLARYLGESFVHNLLKSKFKKIEKLNHKLKDAGFVTILLVRLVPIFPFTATSFAFGLTKMKFSHFFFGTLLGALPGSFAYASLGSGLATMNFFQLGIAIFVIILLSLSVYIYKNMNQKLKEDEYDIIVIGAGAAGLNIASFMNKVGFDVLMIEQEEGRIGGDCLNYGCVPSKSLIHIARQVHSGKVAENFGVEQKGEVDMKKVKEYVHDKVETIREHENKEYFEKKGIDVEIGRGKFVNKNQVKVNGKTYKAKKIVLATGARPRELGIPGSEDVTIHNNETIWDVEELPEKMVIVGGGFVGLELAQAFQYLGSEVHVFERGDRVLKPAPEKVSEVVEKNLRESGVKVHKNASAKKFEKGSLIVENADGTEESFDFDLVFASIGRIANTDNVELENAGIDTTERGKLATDKYLRTTNKDVYACGDVVGQHQFTHATEMHAGVILKNLFSSFKTKLNTDHIAWTMFTDPEVSVFGLQEQQLKERNIEYEVLENDFTDDDRAIVGNFADESFLRLFIDKKDRIRGGFLIAPEAGEMAQELILANSEGLKVDKLFNKTYPYPTASKVNKSTIAQYMGKKLSSFNKKILQFLYKLK